jgi:DNA mismatch endonuclease (patch repair protein)
MSRVKNKNTAPEVRLRSALHRLGLRFQLHSSDLPGRPDIVFRSARVAVFIDGRFWHGYQFERWSEGLQPYWREKIERTRQRDVRQRRALRRMGWCVVRVWDFEIMRAVDRAALRVRGQVARKSVRVRQSSARLSA